MSPTSLGFEAYQLLVIQNPEIREKMKAYGWGIQAGLEASHFVVFLTRKKVDLEFDSPYVRYIQEAVSYTHLLVVLVWHLWMPYMNSMMRCFYPKTEYGL